MRRAIGLLSIGPPIVAQYVPIRALDSNGLLVDGEAARLSEGEAVGAGVLANSSNTLPQPVF